MKLVKALLGAAALAIPLAAAHASGAYPDRPIKIVVPFGAGSASDTVARVIAEEVRADLGTVIVDNKAGANGIIGAASVAKAAPDGYTLVLTSSATHSGIGALYKQPGYDPIQDFVHVSRIATIPMVLVARPDAPFQTAQELATQARKSRLRHAYGSGSAHIAGATFGTVADAPSDAVPYKSQPPAVRALHPSVLYVELSGDAQQGPYAGRAAFDDIIQAQLGLAELFARQSGGEPAYVPTLVADRVTGLTAAHATLAALYQRQATGEGAYLRVSMFETMAAMVLGDHLGGASFEPAAGPMGYSRLLTRHRRPYRTLDGYIAVVVYNDRHWRAFFDAIGQRAVFEADARFQTAAVRAERYDFIYAALADLLATRSTADWLALLQAADIPCSPVNRVEDLLDEPQLRAVGFFDESGTQQGRKLRRIAARYRAPAALAPAPAAAPTLGQHQAACLFSI